MFLTQFHPAVTGMNLCGSYNRKILALYRALPDSPTAISGIPARKCTSTPLPHPLSLSGLALASAARVLSFVIALDKFIIVCLKFLSIAKRFPSSVVRLPFTEFHISVKRCVSHFQADGALIFPHTQNHFWLLASGFWLLKETQSRSSPFKPFQALSSLFKPSNQLLVQHPFLRGS